MNSQDLPLKVGCQLDGFNAGFLQRTFNLIAVVFRFGRLIQVEYPGVPGRYLGAFVAQLGNPFGDALKIIIRFLIS